MTTVKIRQYALVLDAQWVDNAALDLDEFWRSEVRRAGWQPLSDEAPRRERYDRIPGAELYEDDPRAIVRIVGPVIPAGERPVE